MLVLGAGAIGLCAALVARDRAAEVAITARYPHQRAAAERIGVTVLDEDEAVTWGKEHRPEVVIESVGGTADTLTDAVRVVGRGGRDRRARHLQRAAAGGPAAPDDEGGVDRRLVLLRQRRLASRSSRRPPASPVGGATSSPALTTHQLPLEEVADAFGIADDKSTGAIKVTLTP